MIKTLSPHYKIIPWNPESIETIPDKYILSLYVWSGLKSSKPDDASYEIENINPLERTGDSYVDISSYINEFIDANLVTDTETSINDSNALVWVYTEVSYYIGSTSQGVELEEYDYALKGYGYGDEGINPTTPTNNYLATAIEQKVYKEGVYIFNFLASETESTVIKLESENTTKTFTKTLTTNSNELVQSCYVKVSEFSEDEYIEIYKDNALITTLLITDEPRYNAIDFVFLNKEGTHQTVTFFKRIKNNLEVTRENYQSSFGQPLDGVHQFVDFNINGREGMQANSGFVKEDNNEIYTQLLLSSQVWILENNIYIPVNVTLNNLEYQTRQQERLLNYKIDFKKSYNKINNI